MKIPGTARRANRVAAAAAALIWLPALLLGTARADAEPAPETTDAGSAIGKRIALERYTRDLPYVLNAHRPNYILPLSYISDASQAIDEDLDGELQEFEIQFQLSLKVLLIEDLYNDQGQLSVAYTNRSFWQAYNRDISSAFRETNHEPELILTFESGYRLFGFRNPANQFIFNHQSNGRFGEQSRSWNRIMVNTMFEKDDFIFSFKPWFRIPEDDKEFPGDPSGDDNPDIEDYMGNFELTAAWLRSQNLYTLMVRNNLDDDDNRGAIELSWSFPLNRRIKGFVKLFHGYGQSLISYDQKSTSIGAGFLISDWL